MPGEFIGFAAVVLTCSIPVAGFYLIYHLRRLKSQERLAAIEKGVSIPAEADMPHHARSRRASILLLSGGIGWFITFWLISRLSFDSDVIGVALLGILPITVGIGCMVDATLLRREARPS